MAVLALAAGLGAGACNAGRRSGEPSANGAGDTSGENSADTTALARIEIDVFALGRVQGTIAPCGCTSFPLGGVQHVFGHIATSSQPGARLLIEPGSLLFPDADDPERPTDAASWHQAELRAGLLADAFGRFEKELVSGLGPSDLPAGRELASLERWPLPRVLTNARERPPGVAAFRRIDLPRELVAGVMVVVDPTLGVAAGPDFPALVDPEVSLRTALEELERAGVDLRVAVVHGPRELAESLARAIPAIDLVVVGGVIEGVERGRVGAPATRIDTDGDATWIVEPGDRGQTLTHLRLSLDPSLPAGSLPAPAAWTLITPAEQLREQLASADARLAKFRADPEADAGFLARLTAERDDLAAELVHGRERAGPVTAEFRQVAVSCELAVDGESAAALREYDASIAAENQRRFAGVFAPPPAKGAPTYVGDDECEMCHDAAAGQWATTVHARAYDTLVTANKQFDLSCVGCHVTAFRERGGSEVVETRGLTAVQCEQCHGPGSQHAADDDRPMRREVPEAVCGTCHTPEHSDTFDYEAYLRDVLGPGHGEAKRTALGEGPTAKELRAAARMQAGTVCPAK